MKLWPARRPLDPTIALLIDQNQALVSQNVALVERIGKLVGQLARSEPAKETAPLRGVAGGRGPLPNYDPGFWRSDEGAEVQNDGVVGGMTQEEVDAAEQALKESFRQSMKEAR